MERDKLVKRRPSLNDSRAVEVWITPLGREVYKELMPEACIGVDVIVGFPGETHEDFLETYQFLNELDISYLHVFTYSERPNTLAIDMKGVVPKKERSERSKMLRSLSEKKRRYFRRGSFIAADTCYKMVF